MIFVDHAFEESPSRTTEPASYEQPTEEQGTSPSHFTEGSANEAEQGGNNVRHTDSQQLSGAPGDKQETNMEDFATVLENFEAEQTEAMAAMENKVLAGTVLKLTSSYL